MYRPGLFVVGVAEADRCLTAVLGTAAAFGQAGYPYQEARTLVLAGRPPLIFIPMAPPTARADIRPAYR